MADLLRFPVELISDRAIVNALRPYVERAIREHPAASVAEIAAAACRLIDPEAVSPPLVREGCTAALETMARDIRRGES